MSDTKKYTSKILSKREVASHTIAITYEKPEGFNFTAGQFIEVTLPYVTDERGSIRPFSIVSSPDQDHLELATRVRDTDYKQALSTLEAGNKITFEGPFGNFVLHADVSKPAVFLVGGIGITPIMSVLRDEKYKKTGRKLCVVYSNKRPEDSAFLDELLQLASEEISTKIISTMTDDKDLLVGWNGEMGYIDSGRLIRNVPDYKKSVFYIVGSAAFVDAMMELLNEMGIDDLMIRNEAFSGY